MESLAASVTSTTTMSALVDTEVYGRSRRKVFQRWYDNQLFAAGHQRSYIQAWQVPANAEGDQPYVVKIGIFSTGWSGRLYAWNDRAATFTVE